MKRRANLEGSLFFSDTEKTWIAEVVLPDGRKKRKRSKKQSVVKDWLLSTRNLLKDGDYVENNTLTVSDFLERFLEDAAKRTLKPKTVSSYEYLIKDHITPEIGHLKLSSLRTIHVQTLVNRKMDTGLSNRTVQYIHAVLRRGLNQAIKWGLLNKNPAIGVEVPSPPKVAPEVLTVDQLKTFLNAVEGHPYYPIYLIAIGCGLRESEILGLEKSDIRFNEGMITVRQTIVSIKGKATLSTPKTQGSRRSVAMPEFVSESLRGFPDGFLFTTRTGKPVNPRNLLRHFHTSLEKAGIPRVKFHSLRHSFATIHLESGTNPKIVQEALGHSSISLTLNIYSHVIPHLQKEAARKMDTIFKP